MPAVAPVAGAARETVDLDLLALAVPHDLRSHLRALQHRFPRLHVLAVAREQDLVEGHLAPGLGREQRDLDGDPGLGAELRAAGGENCVGHGWRILKRGIRIVKVGGGWRRLGEVAPVTISLPYPPQPPKPPKRPLTRPHAAPTRRAPPASTTCGSRPAASSGRRST